MDNNKIGDSFVVGYSSDEGGDSALVVLRPRDPEHNAEYDEVCSYAGATADMVYRYLCGVDFVAKIEADQPKYSKSIKESIYM